MHHTTGKYRCSIFTSSSLSGHGKETLEMVHTMKIDIFSSSTTLQKYRIFLKQVEESAAQKRTSLSGLPSMLGNDIETTQDILDISIPRPLQAFQPDYQGIYSIQGYHQSNNTSLFPTKAPMNGGILSKFGSLGKPNCSLSTTSSRAGGWKQPIVPGNRVQSGLYQPGSPMTAAPMNQASGTNQRNLHLMGDYASYDSGYSAQGLGNMRQMHHQESLLAPELYNSRMLRCGVGSSGMSNVNSCVGGTGSFANCVAPPSLSELNSNSNYVGTRLSGNGHFHRLGRPQPSGTGAEINWLEAGFGSIGGTRPCTEKLTTSGQGTSNRTYFTPQQASASTFWPADSSEGFSTISDQGIDASNNEENHYAINELVRNVLGTGSGNSHQLISGEGCPKSSPLERVNYQSAVPVRKF